MRIGTLHFISYLHLYYEGEKCGEVKIFADDSNVSNFIQEDIEIILNWGNASYHQVQNPLSSRLLPIKEKKLKYTIL
jgi:hypothetical protein